MQAAAAHAKRACVAAAAAPAVCGVPAALRELQHSPLMQYEPGGAQVDWTRVDIVGSILVTAIVVDLTILAVIPNVIDSTLTALLGVALMCWLGIMTEADAFKDVNWNGIWIIVGYFGKTGHRIDPGSPARWETWYCKRAFCPKG